MRAFRRDKASRPSYDATLSCRLRRGKTGIVRMVARSSTFPRWSLGAALALFASLAIAEPVYRVRQLDELSDKRLSVLGQQVLKADAERWHYGESMHFIGYACSNLDLDQLMRQAEFAHGEIGAYLNLKPATEKLHIFLLENDRLWSASMKKLGMRPDGLACQIDRELYLKYDYDQNRRPDRVAHEVIHARLRAAYGKEIPLWLDEGLASYYGWRISRQYARRRGAALTRVVPAVPERKLMLMDPLTGLRTYPPDPESAQAFYRQSEELFIAVHEKIGDGDVPRLVNALCGASRGFTPVMQTVFGFSAENLAVLERTVRERSMQERKE
jgi:hypothetical protein